MELIISVRATVSDEKEIFCHLIDLEVRRAERGGRENIPEKKQCLTKTLVMMSHFFI